MKNLIVYLSPVEKAQNIVEYANRLAQQLQLNIHYIYNIDTEKLVADEGNENSKEEFLQELIAEKRGEIEAIIKNSNPEPKDIESVFSIFTGSLRAVFKTPSVQAQSKLVLLAVEEKTSYTEQRLNQILDASKLPVWCFKPNKEYRPVKTITYATDYRKHDINVLKSFIWIAKAFDAKINMLHVYRRGKFKQQLLDAGLRELVDKKIKYSAIEIQSKKKGSVVKGIAKFSEKSFADLVVLLKKDKYFFQDLLRKTTIEKTLNKLDLPLLVYKK